MILTEEGEDMEVLEIKWTYVSVGAGIVLAINTTLEVLGINLLLEITVTGRSTGREISQQRGAVEAVQRAQVDALEAFSPGHPLSAPETQKEKCEAGK